MWNVFTFVKNFIEFGKIRPIVVVQGPTLQHELIYVGGALGRAFQPAVLVLNEIQHLHEKRLTMDS